MDTARIAGSSALIDGDVLVVEDVDDLGVVHAVLVGRVPVEGVGCAELVGSRKDLEVGRERVGEEEGAGGGGEGGALALESVAGDGLFGGFV